MVPIILEPVYMVLSVKIQQLAENLKESRESLETPTFQSCSDLGCQGPTFGTLVPQDSEIQEVAVQNLMKQIIFSYSVLNYKYGAFNLLWFQSLQTVLLIEST